MGQKNKLSPRDTNGNKLRVDDPLKKKTKAMFGSAKFYPKLFHFDPCLYKFARQYRDSFQTMIPYPALFTLNNFAKYGP